MISPVIPVTDAISLKYASNGYCGHLAERKVDVFSYLLAFGSNFDAKYFRNMDTIHHSENEMKNVPGSKCPIKVPIAFLMDCVSTCERKIHNILM